VDADDERDPLDRWLSQQVQPLPPPPGTFELISKRARRRKARKLAVTLVSAAAVAAAVAVAVPVGLNLHLSPSPTPVGNAADRGTASAHSESPAGSATPDKTASPTPASSQSSAPSGQAHPVPANFQPTSVTFVSALDAWAIGQAGTPGTCANKDAYICTSVARTEDGGRTWQGSPAPDTGAPNAANGTGVSGIRFLNAAYGWAFGPELWSTDNGGATWTQVETAGARVTDLETSRGRAYALWANGCSAPGAGGSAADFAAGCTSYTLMTATEGSGDWTPVGTATSGLTNGGAPASAVLQLAGTTGYLLGPDGALYSGAIGGTWTQVGTSACKPGAAQADGQPSAAQLALVDSQQLWIACNGTPGTAPALYESDSGGSTWTQPPAASWSGVNVGDLGTTTSLAAAPNGTLTLATTTGIYYLPANGERWQASNATGSGAPAGGFSYVGMTNNDQGVAVPADTSLHEVWMTADGGASWAPATSITPGN
jgi:hypothetical protein